MKKRFLLAVAIIILGLILAIYYLAKPSSHTLPPPVVLPATPAAPTHFVDLAQQAGIDYQWTLPGKQPRNILQMIGNGCAFLDYDNDGNLDILLVGPHLALFKGDGHGHFTDVTHQTGLDKIHGNFLGCAVADYDNDGYDDIFLTGYNTAALLRNEQGKAFRDVTKESGIKTNTWSTSAAWGDIDNDGKLDLYVCSYVVFGPQSQQLCDKIEGATRAIPGLTGACGPYLYPPEYGVLYHNDGHGHFTDVTKAWGLDKTSGKGLGAAFAPFDGTGRQGLFIANDLVPSNLYVNRLGRFYDVSNPSGTSTLVTGGAYSGMGVDWGDYDNDGKLDLAAMDFSDQDKQIFHNEGSYLFSNRSIQLGMHDTSYPWVTFGAKWIDYDNDGWLDLIMCEGSIMDTVEKFAKKFGTRDTLEQPTMLYHNDHGQHFDNVSKGLEGQALRPILGRGLAVGDYDNDGKMDVLVVDSMGKPLLLHNETPGANHWLIVRLVGTKSNRDGLGALVTADTGAMKLTRLCQTDGSYMSASDKRVHIGLGAATQVKSLTIQWPSGHIDTIENVTADQIITVTEAKGLTK
jgi:hypothetical protein